MEPTLLQAISEVAQRDNSGFRLEPSMWRRGLGFLMVFIGLKSVSLFGAVLSTMGMSGHNNGIACRIKFIVLWDSKLRVRMNRRPEWSVGTKADIYHAK